MFGEDRTAEVYSARRVWPLSLGTVRFPPSSRASNPGANGAIQYFPAL
jgi:hypothetical protein